MERFDYGFNSIDAFSTAPSERETSAVDKRLDAMCDREGAAGPRFSIDRLWDVLQPAAAIF